MQPITGAAINIGDKCYIGKETEDRTQIDHVRARVNYSDLTHTAQKNWKNEPIFTTLKSFYDNDKASYSPNLLWKDINIIQRISIKHYILYNRKHGYSAKSNKKSWELNTRIKYNYGRMVAVFRIWITIWKSF